jgi:hypothetical protein
VLRRSTLYKSAQYHGLFYHTKSSNVIPPWDKRYPLISWITTPFKEEGPHMNLELLYNKKHKCGRFVVENSFSILKKTFQKLLEKINLHVTFVPNVSTCCLLHNFATKLS